MSSLVSFASWVSHAPRGTLAAIVHRRRDLARTDSANPAQFAGLAATKAAVATGLESLNAAQLRLAWELAKRSRVTPLITGIQPSPELTALIHAALVWPSGDGYRIQTETTTLLPTTASATARNPSWAQTQPPEPTQPTHVDQAVAANAAAAAVTSVLTDVGAVVEAFAELTPSQLVRGGVGKRDITQIASHTGLSVSDTVLLTELAAHLGLIAVGGNPDDPQWLPTSTWDRFFSDRASAYAAVVAAWCVLDTNIAEVCAGTTSTGDKVHVLGDYPPRALGMPFARFRVLTLLAQLSESADNPSDPATQPGNPTHPAFPRDYLAAWLTFTHPLHAELRVSVHTILDKAERLGLVFTPLRAPHSYALTTLGLTLATHLRAVMTDDLNPRGFDPDRVSLPEGFTDLVTPMLPHLHTTVITQSDLTAIATGPLHPSTVADLTKVATVETRGQGTVFRFTTQSITHALESGMSTDAIRTLITGLSSTPLPGPLDFLITDTAAKLGRVTVAAARGVIVVNDPAELDPLLSAPLFTAAKLTRVAPTVAVAQVGPERLSALLSTQGIDTLGTPPTAPKRAPAPRKRAPVRRSTNRVTDVEAFVDALTSTSFSLNAEVPVTIADTIRNAVDSSREVVLEVATTSGIKQTMTITPVGVAGGLVRGTQGTQEFAVPLSRIISAREVS